MLDSQLRSFQRTWIRRSLAPGIDLGVLSIPRGNGKTALAAHVVALAMTPGSSLYKPNNEVVLISGSTAQSRFAHKFVKRELEELGLYRWSSSLTSMGARDTKNGVELRVMSSNPRTAHGLVGVSMVFCDEPSSWENQAGSDMWDAILTAQGRCCTARSKSLTSLCRLQSHPAQYVSGIPSAAILLSISHPIRCSTRCLANVRARISGPMIAL